MDEVQQVKDRIDIAEIMGASLKLIRAGKNFKALCPFHGEKSPSLVISPDRQMWHCFGCFPAGAKIKTPFGYHNIEEIDTNHWVVSGKGNLKKVTQTMAHQYKGDLVTVRLRKLGGGVQLTSDHTVFAIRGAPYTQKHYKDFAKRYRKYLIIRSTNKDKYYYLVNKYFPIREIPAGELQLGDLLLYPIRRVEQDIDVIDLSLYLTKHTKLGPVPKKIPLKISVNDDLLKLIGYYVAEGSNHRGYIRFSLGNHEEEFASEIVLLIKSIFGLEAKIHRRPTLLKTGIELTACHSQLANIFENLCGKGAANKHIPFIFQDLPSKKQAVILHAIHKGDGTTFIAQKSNNYHKSITSISRVLSEQLVDIILRANLFPTLHIEKAKIDALKVNHQEAYTVFWSEEIRQKYGLIYYKEDGTEYWLLPITQLNKEPYEGQVFNFTVAEDHSYVATNFAVANCGKGGDVFTFMMEYDKVDFSESLKILAEKAGVKLSGPVYRTDAERKKDIVYELNHLSANYYNYLLLSHPVGKSALAYLTDTRKMPVDLIKKFNLGFAPPRDTGLVTYLTKKKKYDPQDLLNAGLVTMRAGRLSDFFRNRIIFPIQDVRGNTIAFSGRVINDAESPKYINTRETMVYHKGDTLYGLFHAKDAIRTEKRVIVMEGEFDVLSSFKEGITNTVAVKGTALTENQIKLLKRFAEKVSFCFDTDSAGIEAQKRSIALIEKEGIVATIIVPPKGKDADELLRKSPGQFKAALKNDVNMYDYVIDEVVREQTVESAEGKKKILEQTLPLISIIENEVVREHYLRKIAELLNSSFEAVVRQAEKLSRLQKPVPQKADVVQKARTTDADASDRLEFYLMSLLLQAKHIQGAFELANPFLQDISLTNPVYNRLYAESAKAVGEQNAFVINDFAKTLPQELVEAFDTAYLSPLHAFPTEKDYSAEIKRIAATLRTLILKNTLKKLTEEIKAVEDQDSENAEAELMRLNEEFSRIAHLLHKS